MLRQQGKPETCLWESASPHREQQGRVVQREWERTYMAGKVIGLRLMSQNKKSHESGLTCGGIYKWAGGTVHGRSLLVCLAQQHGAYGRERERWYLVGGQACYTWEITATQTRKAEKWKHSHTPERRMGTPREAPCLSQRGLVGAHPPSPPHTCHSFAHGVWVVGSGFRSGMQAAWHNQKGALEISQRTGQQAWLRYYLAVWSW